MGIIGLIQTVLTILAEYLKWKRAETEINARKLVYDIDQQVLARGALIKAKIDSARNAGDLTAAAQLLDDYQANALYAAGVRLAIPDDAGRDNVGERSGISTGAASGRGSDDRAQPAQSTKPS